LEMDELKQDLTLKETEDRQAPSPQPEVAQIKQPDLQNAANEAEIVPGYRIGEQIAEGSSGRVYKAHKESDGSAVAIKLFKKELVPDADALRRFGYEVETLGKLNHPSIIRIHSSGSTREGIPYIITELMDGLTIRQSIDANGVFEPKRAATIAREICRALSAAHAQSIIHRDLKPNNIIIDNQNIAKVVDFGIAKAVGSSSETITQYGAIIGTPAYMSPEQCLGQKVDERTDLYALGCTIFEMLTGVKAFNSATPVEGIAKQISPDRSHIKKLLRSTGAPQDLQTIVAKCVEREPIDRYTNVAELEHDLGCFVVGKPPSFAIANRRAKQLAAVCIAAVSVLLLVCSGKAITYFSNAPQPTTGYVGQSFGAPPLSTTEIRDASNGKIIFSDPTATTMAQALQDASDRKVSLRGANLRGAHLTQSVIGSLDLSGADLTDAQLAQIKWTDVDLHNAVLTRANLASANLLGVNLRNAQLNSARLASCQAPSTILENANLSDADVTHANLERASCVGTNFTRARLSQANLDEADCTNANFSDANLMLTHLSGAICSHAKFERAIMHQTDFSGARLAGADFQGVRSSRIKIMGADIANTQFGRMVFDSRGYLSGSYY
jgi:serine/threonine protein kinase